MTTSIGKTSGAIWAVVLVVVLVLAQPVAFVDLAAAANSDPEPTSLESDTPIEYPNQITLGESATIRIVGENEGGKAGHWSTITASFPSLNQDGDAQQVSIKSHDFDTNGNTLVADSGDDIINKYGNQVTASYALAEAGKDENGFWEGSYTEHEMTVDVTPEETGTFEVYVRVTMTDDDDATQKFNWPSSSSYTDQQDFRVYRIEIDVEPPTGNLDVYADDENGYDADDASMVLYDDNWNEIDTEYADYYGKADWTDKPTGTYHVEVYGDRGSFWGSKTVDIYEDYTTTEYIDRYEPYETQTDIVDQGDGDGTHIVGETVNISPEIKNDGSAARNTRVKIEVDTDDDGKAEISKTRGPETIYSNGDTQWYGYDYVPQSTGTKNVRVLTESEFTVDGQQTWVKTGDTGWHKTVDVKSDKGSVSVTAENEYANKVYDASVVLYDGNWNEIGTKGTSSGSASWSGLDPGEYHVEVYSSNGGLWGGDTLSVEAATTTPSTVTRYEPYETQTDIVDEGDGDGRHIVGETVSISPQIKNDGSAARDTRVKIEVDTDDDGTAEISKTRGPETIYSDDTQWYGYDYVPQSAGTKQIRVITQAEFTVDGQQTWAKTGDTGWHKIIDVLADEGDVTTTVVDESGNTVGSAVAILYDGNWNEVSEKTTNSYGDVSWTGLDSGTYYVEAYSSNGAFWGSDEVSVEAQETTTTTITRYEPYETQTDIVDKGDGDGTHIVGETVNVSPLIQNDGSAARDTRVKIKVDTDDDGTADITETRGPETIGGGGDTQWYGYDYVPDTTGTKQIRVVTESEFTVDGQQTWIRTGDTGWHKTVDVERDTGTLDVTVQDENGQTVSGTSVVLYDDGWNEIGTRTTASDGSVAWSTLDPGTYHFEVYGSNGALWGGDKLSIEAATTTSPTIQRYEPYETQTDIVDKGDGDGTHIVGEIVNISPLIRNNGSAARDTRVKIKVDTDDDETAEITKTRGPLTIDGNGDAKWYGYDYVPETSGTKQIRVVTESEFTVDGQQTWAKTGDTGWHKTVDVKRNTGTLEVHAKDEFGNRATDTSVVLYTGDWSETISTKDTGADGTATWSGLDPDSYNVEVYHGEEFWGGDTVDVAVASTNSTTVTRYEPYETATTISDADGDGSHIVDGTVGLTSKVRNDGSADRPTRVRLLVDIDGDGTAEKSRTTDPKTIGAGTSVSFSDGYTPETTGTKRLRVTVESKFRVDGSETWVVTDDSGWAKRFDVYSEPQDPVVGFEYLPTDPEIGETVTFTSSAYDVDGDVVSTTWEFDGPASTVTKTGEEVTASFSEAGTVSATLTVEDDDGYTNVTSRQLVVGTEPATMAGVATATDSDGQLTTPLADADVYLYRPDVSYAVSEYIEDSQDDGSTTVPDSYVARTATGDDGGYEFAGLPAGEYVVLVVPNSTEYVPMKSVATGVAGGETRTVDLTVEPNRFLASLDDEMVAIETGSKSAIDEETRTAAEVYVDLATLFEEEQFEWDSPEDWKNLLVNFDTALTLMDTAMSVADPKIAIKHYLVGAVGGTAGVAFAEDWYADRMANQWETVHGTDEQQRLAEATDEVYRQEWLREFSYNESVQQALDEGYHRTDVYQETTGSVEQRHETYDEIATTKPHRNFSIAETEDVLQTQAEWIRGEGVAPGVVISPTGDVYLIHQTKAQTAEYYGAKGRMETAGTAATVSHGVSTAGSAVAFVGGVTVVGVAVSATVGTALSIGGAAAEMAFSMYEVQARNKMVDHASSAQLYWVLDLQNVEQINDDTVQWLRNETRDPRLHEVDGEITGTNLENAVDVPFTNKQVIVANRPNYPDGWVLPTYRYKAVGNNTVTVENTGSLADAQARIVVVDRYGEDAVSDSIGVHPGEEHPPMELDPGESETVEVPYSSDFHPLDPFNWHYMSTVLWMEGKLPDVQTDVYYVAPSISTIGSPLTADSHDASLSTDSVVQSEQFTYSTAETEADTSVATEDWREYVGNATKVVDATLDRTNDSATVSFDATETTNETTFVLVTPPRGDADLHVTDSLDRHVGYDPGSDADEALIPGSTYSGSTTNPEVTTITRNANGTFEITVNASAFTTASSIPVEVYAVETPRRPAILGVTPARATSVVSPDRSKQLSITAAEVGKQHAIDSVEVTRGTFTNLAGDSLSATNVSVRLSTRTFGLNASENRTTDLVFDAGDTVDLPDDEPTEYTGPVEINTSTAGTATVTASVLLLDTDVSDARLAAADDNVTGVHLHEQAVSALPETNHPPGTSVAAYDYDASGNGTVRLKLSSVAAESNDTVTAYEVGDSGVWTPLNTSWNNDTVTVTATTSDSTIALVRADHETPYAAIGVEPRFPTANATATLNASASRAPNGTLVGFRWDVDDDPSFERNGRTATHTFDSPGEHAVRLRIVDDEGVSTVTERVVVVDEPVPSNLSTFSGTKPLGSDATNDSSLAGTLRVEDPYVENATVDLLTNSSNNYTLAVNITGDAENVTFYVQKRAVTASGSVEDIALSVDDQPQPFHVDEHAGPANSQWLAFNVEHFSTRQVTFTVSADSNGGGGGGGGGGGSGSVPPPSILKTIEPLADGGATATVKNGLPGRTARLFFDDGLVAGSATFDRIDLHYGYEKPELSFAVHPSADAPAGASALEGALGYLRVEESVQDAIFEDVTVHFTVDESALPQDASLDDVVLYRYGNGGWTAVETTHRGNDFEAVASGLATYAVGVDRSAESGELSVSVADLGHSQIPPGESVEITATVENPRESTGEFDVILEVDGEAVATKTVNLDAGESRDVTFVRTFQDEGTYEVAVNGASAGTLVVDADAATTDDGTTSGGQPGFGAAIALFALVAALGGWLVRRE